MAILKQLIKGELSLAVTFWVFGSLSIFILPTLAFIAYSKPLSLDFRVMLIAAIFLIRFLISLMVLLGLFFILRNKNQTFWGSVAFIIAIVNFIYAVVDIFISISKLGMFF